MTNESAVKRAIMVAKGEGLVALLTKTLDYCRRTLILNYIPMTIYVLLAPLFWKQSFSPERSPVSIRWTNHEGVWIVSYADGTRMYSPNPKIKTGRRLHVEDRLRDNTLPGFITIDPGDVVVDVGAFVGAFSVGAAEDADTVYAIEADPANAYCAKQNTFEYENIEVIQRAVWNENTTLEFQIGSDPTDSSLLSPDFGGQQKTVDVPAETLDSIFSRYEITCVDFLKMDAEGVEPEALSGLQDVAPQKIAIDAGAEREGEDTIDEVTEILMERGYEIKSKGNMIYGKL